VNELVLVKMQSENGDDTLDVPEKDLPGRVAEELKKDTWATVKHNDGSKELLTKKDLPIDEEELSEADKALQAKAAGVWKDVFKPVEKAGVEEKWEKPKQTTPVTKPSKPREEWTSKFERVESVTVTKPNKGG
jgi:hypothetical protein